MRRGGVVERELHQHLKKVSSQFLFILFWVWGLLVVDWGLGLVVWGLGSVVCGLWFTVFAVDYERRAAGEGDHDLFGLGERRGVDHHLDRPARPPPPATPYALSQPRVVQARSDQVPIRSGQHRLPPPAIHDSENTVLDYGLITSNFLFEFDQMRAWLKDLGSQVSDSGFQSYHHMLRVSGSPGQRSNAQARDSQVVRIRGA